MNKEKNVIYVGSTSDLTRRMSGHKHLPTSCYQETEFVEVAGFEDESDMYIYEVYFINKWLPKYNRSMRGQGTAIRMKAPHWEPYDNPFKELKIPTKKPKPVCGYRLIEPDGHTREFKEKYEVKEYLCSHFNPSEMRALHRGKEIDGFYIERIR